jgi:hypothetical protein
LPHEDEMAVEAAPLPARRQPQQQEIDGLLEPPNE